MANTLIIMQNRAQTVLIIISFVCPASAPWHGVYKIGNRFYSLFANCISVPAFCLSRYVVTGFALLAKPSVQASRLIGAGSAPLSRLVVSYSKTNMPLITSGILPLIENESVGYQYRQVCNHLPRHMFCQVCFPDRIAYPACFCYVGESENR